MSKKVGVFLIIISALVVGASIFICLSFYAKLDLKDIYIAKYHLSNRTLISENEIEKIKVPSSYLNDEVILNKEDIIDKYVKMNCSIPKGSFFYKGSLDSLDNMKDKINAYLSDGEVAYDIYLKDIKANPAYLIKGMYIDLYLTINKDIILSDLLINNLKIINLYDINNNEIKDYDDKSIIQSFCLAVPKEYVSYLNKAQVIGELRIVLGENPYEDVKSILNIQSKIFDYLNDKMY